ncbi:phage tail protein [Aquabacter cavernae]|uniref:phage tail protein n=1 Tax=Aquabacter cavernae TaxID=2496029 RepID=UPI000F8DC044|nr:tail fiber protein [Aquabacter cavernae]
MLNATSDEFVGEIRLFAGQYAPRGWKFCNGAAVLKKEYSDLYELIGSHWGELDDSFFLPDLRGLVPVCQGAGPNLTLRRFGEKMGQEKEVAELASHTHAMRTSDRVANSLNPHGKLLARVKSTASAKGLYLDSGASGRIEVEFNRESVTSEGGDAAHDNYMPSLALNYIISVGGDFPEIAGVTPPNDPHRTYGSIYGGYPFAGEIRCFALGWPNIGEEWIPCDGRLLQGSRYPNLEAVIGYAFGGNDSMRYFNVPDLRGHAAVGANAMAPLTSHQVGNTWGSDHVSLTVEQMPRHFHPILGAYTSVAGQLEDEPSNRKIISRTNGQFNYVRGVPQQRVNMHDASLQPTGAGRAHENRQPFQALGYYICRQGEFIGKGD